MSKFKIEHLGMKVGITVVTLGIVAYTGIASTYENKFWNNTWINDTNVSKMTVQQAEEQLSLDIQDYELELVSKEGETSTIYGKDIDLAYDFHDDVLDLMRVQDPFGWITGFFGEPSVFTHEFELTYDEALLENLINEISFMRKDNMTAPVNASITYNEENGFVYVPSDEGNMLDMTAFDTALKEALKEQTAKIDLKEASCYILPEVTEEDPQIKQELERLKGYTDRKISYAFGDIIEEITPETLMTWYRQDESGTIYLKESAVGEYVKELAKKYDTVGAARKFVTNKGKEIKVSGGPYGWRIHQDKETQHLIQLINEKKDEENRQPIYRQTGFEEKRGTSDIGDTYIEISIEDQHMWYYEDGKLYLDTDVVTGNGGNHTKRGVAFIYNHARNATLVGDDYVSFVKYWMKVWGGIGIHDASWRSKFGGKIYLTNGSHGCINTPLENVKKLYERVENGTPVVIY